MRLEPTDLDFKISEQHVRPDFDLLFAANLLASVAPANEVRAPVQLEPLGLTRAVGGKLRKIRVRRIFLWRLLVPHQLTDVDYGLRVDLQKKLML